MYAKGKWVRLYLESQGPDTNMPHHIEGKMAGETPRSGDYTLETFIRVHDNGWREEVDRVMIVNRTYVWSYEILDRHPLDDDKISDEGFGGLGE